MDTVASLYTTTEGRISRKTWWLGVVGLILASIVLNIILSLAGFGINPMAMPGLDPNNPDVAAMVEAANASMRASAWGSLIAFLVLAYPSYALSVKRRHDRDKSGRDVLIYMALTVLLLIVQALGLGMTTMDLGNGVLVPAPSMILSLVMAALGIFAIYLLVVLGFLRGTVGPNTYGPDPAGSAASAAA